MTALTASTLALAAVAEPMAATGAASLAWLLIAVPAAGAALLLLAGRRSDAWGHWLGLLTSVFSAVLGLVILAQVLGLPQGERVVETTCGAGSPPASST